MVLIFVACRVKAERAQHAKATMQVRTCRVTVASTAKDRQQLIATDLTKTEDVARGDDQHQCSGNTKWPVGRNWLVIEAKGCSSAATV